MKPSKEVELAMWKRRASYDPLKAAAEGRKKAEDAKRLAQQQQMMMSSERCGIFKTSFDPLSLMETFFETAFGPQIETTIDPQIKSSIDLQSSKLTFVFF